MLKRLVIFLSLFSSISFADSWRPPTGLKQVSIWPKGAKVLAVGIKKLDEPKLKNPITNISDPTITVYQPKIKSSGVSVIVFPGGGYRTLAMGLEGTEICDWLISKNITCVLLKYRVPYSGCYWDRKTNTHITPAVPMALQDAQRTISTVRYRAKEYGIDPNKVGVMGFSAGGNLAVLSSTAYKIRSYEPSDKIDRVSCRPDFAIPVYPGHMTMEHKNKIPQEAAAKELNTDIVVSSAVPPTLLIHAKDDAVDPIQYSELYESELTKAGADVALKIYKTGGHAFGVRKSGKDTDRWTEDALDWLKQRKFL
jgi:acetyl esterase/lipase